MPKICPKYHMEQSLFKFLHSGWKNRNRMIRTEYGSLYGSVFPN